ncbi:hypothetical protein SEA_ALEEMILY_64 [Gordonia phage Aleemily]|uniref:Uncharacterized protein n=1 Tax=Gordonia phage Aleemily TaxID=2965181 RepID=A0A9E7QBY9_9CAUD|nr:hypothetical protein SEA_ALEEMILY_64 [Gordonia phage Aleemily]
MSDYTDSVIERTERTLRDYADDYADPDAQFGPILAGLVEPHNDLSRHTSRRETQARTAVARRSTRTESESMTTALVSTDLAAKIADRWGKGAPAVIDKSPLEMIPEPAKLTVLTFSKRYPTSPKTYLFAALKVRKNQWTLTGRESGTYTWAQLLQFIGDGSSDGLGVRTIRIATGWQAVADDE